jgi:hypothetical protein
MKLVFRAKKSCKMINSGLYLLFVFSEDRRFQNLFLQRDQGE